jgi:hypothetical protein
MKFIIIFVLLFSFSNAKNDVTKKIEILGNSYNKLYKSGKFIYARNIWDMQVYDGKLSSLTTLYQLSRR